MKKIYKNSLFIFHRDLRLEDNTALNMALKESENVFCCFIFDEKQIKKNEYFSKNAFSFMIDSLEELSEELKKFDSNLNFFYGKSEKVIETIVKENNIGAVYFNKDYTPFAIKRDILITSILNENQVRSFSLDDSLINAPGIVKKEDGGVYTVFTPFYNKSKLIKVRNVENLVSKNFSKNKLKNSKKLSEIKEFNFKKNNQTQKGGRSEAVKILKNINKFKNYQRERDYPFIDKITHLSAHNKFGTVSIREVYFKIKKEINNEALIRQLYWRDFYTQIAFFYPHVFGKSFREKYDNLKWENNKDKIEAWKNGLTGFPIIDAGMRELNKTGFMHNRIRLIVASFLVKNLNVDWRIGEKYFAEKLVDYDPAVNNGNWQWVSGTGTDAQPYFRIFNPWSQQKRFDLNCEYIKKWVEELRDIDPKEIHALEKKNDGIYLKQIVDAKETAKKAIAKYREIG